MWVSRRGVHRACALRKLIPQRASLASSFVKTAHTFSYAAFNGAEKSEEICQSLQTIETNLEIMEFEMLHSFLFDFYLLDYSIDCLIIISWGKIIRSRAKY